MKKLMYILMLVTTCLQSYACISSGNTLVKDESQNDTIQNIKNMRLKITIGNKTATTVLYDNPTTRDFIAQLPLTVDMDDFAGKEKIFYPAKKLSTAERKAVSDPKIGDINVYAPWGNIAIFYGSYSGSPDLIRIGRITEGMDAFSVSGTISKVKFELVK
ncbi:cyclophilin-like fold protein [Pedobacter gandavensis]|uniref:Flavodoxin n=1 Tax=Pedobacter gandavensis TaxID=2679963 RepID=A0ABR6ETN4_9SPHI|nr:cyclophilin-like fold protein [Pedobacter gandavensis]MBB2148626.1 flavodoxin [Pedobacter gandavensis]